MDVRFYLVQVNGEKIPEIAKYEDGIFEMLAHFTSESDEVVLGDGWFSLSRVPTLGEMLSIERKLVKLGLVIEA